MAKKTISKEEYQHAGILLSGGHGAVSNAGTYCQALIELLGDVEPGATTDAVYDGHTDIDTLLAKLDITIEDDDAPKASRPIGMVNGAWHGVGCRCPECYGK